MTSNDGDNQSKADVASPTVASPCIGICVLDVEDVCEGCFRTLDEIGSWSSLDGDQQRDIVKACWRRAKQAGRVF